MKSVVRLLIFAPFLCAMTASCFSLDREAFTFTSYDLSVRVDPTQQRLGVRGKITLRNDSSSPQKIAALQISSSLDWRSIKSGEKPLQFVAQVFTSDIDHTGALSEAIVTLPEVLAPKATVDLDIAYEGVIVLDATRLTRIGTPEGNARSTDWDQIGEAFTALRGVGYVAWYPISTEAANLAEGNDLFEVVGRWKSRELGSKMRLHIEISSGDQEDKPELLVNATSCPESQETKAQFLTDCSYSSLASVVPALVIASYELIERPAIAVHFLPGHNSSAAGYADAADKVLPLISEWFGALRSKAETADLPDANAAAFESGPLLVTALTAIDPQIAGLTATHQLAHAAFASPRPWINEGLAHFAQALYVEQKSGRQAALDYMKLHGSAFAAADRIEATSATAPAPVAETQRSLVNTVDEQLYRSKSMYVWWMLRDMIGDAALKKAIASYQAGEDKDASYMPRLIQAQTQRDLEGFFDDWVYRDRGLPDFKIETAVQRKTLPSGYILTITVANAGAARAEVPIMVKSVGGEASKKIEVAGKSKAVIRMEIPSLPAEVTVNDGSVPEFDVTNNTFKVSEDAAK